MKKLFLMMALFLSLTACASHSTPNGNVEIFGDISGGIEHSKVH